MSGACAAHPLSDLLKLLQVRVNRLDILGHLLPQALQYAPDFPHILQFSTLRYDLDVRGCSQEALQKLIW